jgi:hypothetical protein
MLTISEMFLDGTPREFPAFRVHHPGEHDIVFGNGDPSARLPDGRTISGAHMAILREASVMIRRTPEGHPVYKNRYLDLVIPAKATVLIAEPVLNELQQYRCLQCGIRWRWERAPALPTRRRAKTHCSDERHARTVVGGFCPALQVLDDGERVVPNIEVAPGLTDQVPAPRYDIAEVERRVLARLAKEKAS